MCNFVQQNKRFSAAALTVIVQSDSVASEKGQEIKEKIIGKLFYQIICCNV